jgi:alkanesulfonate monooxygenase SsuD/methylene tetrahydromethanopterin reductase-like flavin-dependent oxidoreductase (luciferase family)
MVSPATFRHPSVLAKTAATADHISGGRVELGLGAGWNEREHAAYGFPFPELSVRLELFAEQLEIVHRQWTEDVFDFHGRHYRLEACRALPRPLQDPHPPLIVGGRAGPGTVEPAVRFADEYNSIWAPPDELRARRRRLDEACERAGRDPASLRFSLMTPVALGRDEDDLAARLARIAARAGAADGAAWHAEHRHSGVIGTLDRARERLAELEEAGVERIFLQHLDHADLDGVALIGELAR